jgi:dephospho-CoA kinase
MDLHSELVNDPRFKDAFKEVQVFGIAGSNGSGKDVLLDMFAESGYFTFNTGDNLRQMALASMGTTQRGGNQSPMGRTANAQRAAYPGGMVSLALLDFWARILHMPQDLRPKGLAIGSIRAVGEAQTLKDFGGKLIIVDADPHVRYDRVVTRARYYEGQITFEQFMHEDEAEMGRGETDPTKFGIAQVMDMADIRLDNSHDSVNDFMAYARKELGITTVE